MSFMLQFFTEWSLVLNDELLSFGFKPSFVVILVFQWGLNYMLAHLMLKSDHNTKKKIENKLLFSFFKKKIIWHIQIDVLVYWPNSVVFFCWFLLVLIGNFFLDQFKLWRVRLLFHSLLEPEFNWSGISFFICIFFSLLCVLFLIIYSSFDEKEKKIKKRPCYDLSETELFAFFWFFVYSNDFMQAARET